MRARERVYVVDFGGQYTHLIARRCRELGVYAEIVSDETVLRPEMLTGVRGVILSGGPRTVTEDDLDGPFKSNIRLLQGYRVKVLGICFGHQLLGAWLGAQLAPGGNPEYGQTTIRVLDREDLLREFNDEHTVWMSHSDEITALPEGVTALAVSGEEHVAAFADRQRGVFGVQFHPEVAHTPRGETVLRAFLREVCGYTETWTPASTRDAIVARIRAQVGDGRVLMATSGGVDSTVAAYLIRMAVGDRLHCVFVDNGLLRRGEREEVVSAFADMGFEHFTWVDAGDRFLTALRGVEDPEEKRRIIAEMFIRVFEEKARQLEEEYGKFDFLGQGTIYPDRVESAATGKSTAVIKSHHNVRLPDWMRLEVVEPLRDLYKDEVRELGLSLGIPEHLIRRQPFPGPSLAIRIGGEVTRAQLEILRHADALLNEELRQSPVYPSIWQSFCVLLPVRSVGVMGDERTFEQVVVIRVVESRDAMTAAVVPLDWELLLRVASRIVNEVAGVNRVVYDLTSKPPGTIEWY